MATKLFVNIAAQSIASALVRAVDNMSPISFPELVIGDGRNYELYFVDGVGGYASFSGDPGYIPYIAIGACGFPSGGTAKWTFNSQTTAALAYNITPAALQTALEALSSIGAGNVSVVGVAGKYYTITFIGAKGGVIQNEITVDFSGLTPASTVEISTIVAGGSGVNNVQLATLAQNPITFADDWTPITNGWTGQLSTRTLEIFQAFAAAGGTLTEVFQVTVADPLGVRTTFLKTPATIQCTIVNPESFAGADKPLLATQAALNAAVLGSGNFTRQSLSSSAAGNTNVTRPATSRHHTAVIAVTGVASTRTFSILTTNSPVAGDTELLVIQGDGTPAVVLEIRNATSGGTLIATITTKAAAELYFVALNWTGAAWQLDFNSNALLSKAGNLEGLADTLISKQNLRDLFANKQSKTVDFTVTTADAGTLFVCDPAAGPILATLPDPTTAGDGFLIALQKGTAAPNVITSNPVTRTLANAGQTMVIRSDGNTWIVVMLFDPGAVTPTLPELILNWWSIVTLLGGGPTALNGIPTAGGATSIGTTPFISANGGQIWRLRSGTDAQSTTIIRPGDFDASTNPVVWQLLLSTGPVPMAIALSAGDQVVTPPVSQVVVIVDVTGTARTVHLDIASGVGQLFKARVNMPSTAGIIVQVRDSVSAAVIYQLTSDDGGGVAFSLYFEAYFDATAAQWKKLFYLSPTV